MPEGRRLCKNPSNESRWSFLFSSLQDPAFDSMASLEHGRSQTPFPCRNAGRTQSAYIYKDPDNLTTEPPRRPEAVKRARSRKTAAPPIQRGKTARSRQELEALTPITAEAAKMAEPPMRNTCAHAWKSAVTGSDHSPPLSHKPAPPLWRASESRTPAGSNRKSPGRCETQEQAQAKSSS